MKRWLAVFFLLLAIAIAALVYLYQAGSIAGPLTTAKTVVIERGIGSRAIARQLAAEGVITSPYPFLLHARVLHNGASLKAGEYRFNAHQTMREIIDQMQRGQVVFHQLTIPEGWTTREVQAALAAEPLLTGHVPAAHEGSILPETYTFERGEARSAVMARMQKAMRETLQKLWQNRAMDLAVQTPEQALILASIIEKETGRHGEREKIAAVFHNRLKRDMPLQADPTVIYAITKGAYKLNRPISKADLRRIDPYNTYTSKGLPPGPICNPGLAAMHATLHPANSEDLYFVADSLGGHYFSDTLAEHNRHVQKLRATEKMKQ